MQIGRKIYYGKSNGLVIWDKGEMEGSVQETTFEQDKLAAPILQIIPAEEIDVAVFEYGQYREEFVTCKGFIINPQTQQPDFVFDS